VDEQKQRVLDQVRLNDLVRHTGPHIRTWWGIEESGSLVLVDNQKPRPDRAQ
jgi:hypothetical protein